MEIIEEADSFHKNLNIVTTRSTKGWKNLKDLNSPDVLLQLYGGGKDDKASFKSALIF